MVHKVLSLASCAAAVAVFLCFGMLVWASPLGDVVGDIMIVTSIADILFALGLFIFARSTLVLEEESSYRVTALRGLGIVGIASVSWIVGVFMSTWVATNFVDTTYTSVYTEASPSFLANVLLGLIFAPIAEEMLIRGFCISRLREAFPDVVTVILSALIFAVMHGTLVHLPLTFLLGLLLGGMRLAGAPLWHCMLVHSFTNFCSLFLASVIAVQPWMVAFPFAHVLYCIVCAAMILAVVFGFWRGKEVEQCSQQV